MPREHRQVKIAVGRRFKYYERASLLDWRDSLAARGEPFHNPCNVGHILTEEECVVDAEAQAVIQGRLLALFGLEFERPPSAARVVLAAAAHCPVHFPRPGPILVHTGSPSQT